MADRLANTCRAHPKTQFIYNSILLTKFNRLNEQIVRFNDYIKALSKDYIPNLLYFDSHAVVNKALRQSKTLTVYYPKERDSKYGNGVHITFEARRIITRELANMLRYLTRNRGIMGKAR